MSVGLSCARNLALAGVLCTISFSSFSQEGPEARAARVCAGLGQSGGNFQGSFDVGNLNIKGSGNGTVTIKRDGVDLANIMPGTYSQYTTCLIELTKLLSPRTEAPTPHPRQSFRICAGNGGGPSCAAGADKYMTCDQYSAIGGGGPGTKEYLVGLFCSYTEKGVTQLFPYSFTHDFSVGGGQCGWTGFHVICNP